MNKRIQELAEQAEMSANKGDHVDVKQMMEKFAELIVQDCLWQIVKDDQVPQNIQALIGERFKEHFGVGMSVEDKKQLIRDLLGVSNDTKS
jgi:uncharacterized protein (UPF0147 family)